MNFQAVYPVISHLLGKAAADHAGEQFLSDVLKTDTPESFSTHPYLYDLARIEEACYSIRTSSLPLPQKIEARIINPTLQLIEVQWSNLPVLIKGQSVLPEKVNGFVLVWQTPGEEAVQVVQASNHDLLALKIVSEQIDSRQAAEEGNVTVGTIDDILYLAAQIGIILTPKSSIVRSDDFPRGEINNPAFFTASTFTLQWHITQTCDLHCRHCYDRSSRTELELGEGIRILDELYDFCRKHHVYTQITFTGGNPLLYPHFNELYKEAADRGFLTAILGNPMPRHRIEEILAIQKPEFYQVSLEGLREHNDYIRGAGHFDRTIDFLALLHELDIYAMVMLTLTRSNFDQVLKLAEQLRGQVDLFTFNRLAMVGEGSALASVEPESYRDFLISFVHAAKDNPCIGYKDNLINILRYTEKEPCFGGCAGYGCGAAFNFVALLPDGEVHACRKFPSYIGNLADNSLHDIYYSDLAKQYRRGSELCSTCTIRPVCGGCMAVGYGFGLDIFKELDPYCFMDSSTTGKG